MLATEMDACCEQARNEGRENPDRAWILTWFDTWEPNPFYVGPSVPHPESEPEGEEPESFDSPRQPEWTGFDSPEMDDPFGVPAHKQEGSQAEVDRYIAGDR